MKRAANDFYRTPERCTKALLAVEPFGDFVWEPACGDGAISRVLEQSGRFVVSTDLNDYGYGAPGHDFLAASCLCAPEIITNPPYTLADEFVLHALNLGATKVAMLLRLAWLEGRARHQRLFAEHPPTRVWVFSGRQTLWAADDPNPRTTGGAIAFAWFVWDAETFPGSSPRLGWLQT